MLDTDNNKTINEKIICDVKNCVYHNGECHCTAKTVAVGPTYASSAVDTVCATFKPKTL